MKILRFSPEIRSSYIERFEHAPKATTFYLERTYLDDEILKDRPEYQQVSVRQLFGTLLRSEHDVVELPEPLWLKMWPLTFGLAVTARIGAKLRGRTVRLSTYAIENADVRALFSWFPRFTPDWLRIKVLWLASIPGIYLMDRIAFGTEGAAETFRAALPESFHRRLRLKSCVVPPLPERQWDTTVDKSGFLFLGSFEARKGVPELLAAWREYRNLGGNGTLTMIGMGPLENLVHQAAIRDAITVKIAPPRAQIHQALSRAKILVLLSQPEGRWREQIGLPILEGIAHGCRVVSTDQTGIADWLSSHNHVVVPTSCSTEKVAEKFLQIESEPFAPMPDSWSTPNGRAKAEEWLCFG